MELTLTHYATGSVITLMDGKRHLGNLTYTRKIHRYDSDSDYQRLHSEHITYGDIAMMAEYSRIQDNQINALRAEIGAS
jgi:hypothetical protein